MRSSSTPNGGRADQRCASAASGSPNIVGSDSALVFADLFKNGRDGRHNGIVVLTIGGSS
jgi:hypothetical protein